MIYVLGGLMKNIIILLTLALSFSSFAQDDEFGDIFGGGENQEFQFERLGDKEIMIAIAREAEIACKDGLCTLSAVTENYNEFSINFNIGEGHQGNSGYGSGNGGTTINVGGDSNGDNREFWGVNVQYKIGKCTQKVNVPRSLYISMNRYLYGLLNEDTSTRRGFTPADEAMILFYTTIMKQASGCNE